MSSIRFVIIVAIVSLLFGCETSREQEMKDECYKVDPNAFRSEYYKQTGVRLP